MLGRAILEVNCQK